MRLARVSGRRALYPEVGSTAPADPTRRSRAGNCHFASIWFARCPIRLLQLPSDPSVESLPPLEISVTFYVARLSFIIYYFTLVLAFSLNMYLDT